METESNNETDDDLKLVIRRLYEIAKEFYKNDLHTHIQPIYNRLTDHEQYVFLKGIIPFLFQAETPPKAIETIGEIEDDFDVEKYNKIELIKLKTWLIKCVIIIISIFLAMAVTYIFISLLSPNSDNENLFEKIHKFVEIILEE